jgi:hypothetical protein
VISLNLDAGLAKQTMLEESIFCGATKVT